MAWFCCLNIYPCVAGVRNESAFVLFSLCLWTCWCATIDIDVIWLCVTVLLCLIWVDAFLFALRAHLCVFLRGDPPKWGCCAKCIPWMCFVMLSFRKRKSCLLHKAYSNQNVGFKSLLLPRKTGLHENTSPFFTFLELRSIRFVPAVAWTWHCCVCEAVRLFYLFFF